MSIARVFGVIAGVGLGAAIAGGISLMLTNNLGDDRLSTGEPATVTASPIGGAFSLTRHDGTPATQDLLKDHVSMIYFGFTFCPDICPAELFNMSLAMEQLGEDADRVLPVFVTIDPERDTPEKMANYLNGFHPRFVGLTGTNEEIAQIARNYRVYYAKRETAGEGDDFYTMDHSSYIYVMDPRGRFVDVLPYGTTPAEIADKLQMVLDRHPAVAS